MGHQVKSGNSENEAQTPGQLINDSPDLQHAGKGGAPHALQDATLDECEPARHDLVQAVQQRQDLLAARQLYVAHEVCKEVHQPETMGGDAIPSG